MNCGKIKNRFLKCLLITSGVLFGVYSVAWANGDDAHNNPALQYVEASSVIEESSVRDGLVVNMNVSPVPAFAGQPVRLDFFVNEKPGNVPVPFYELDVEHTKLMHVVGVRNDLNEFRHIHPEPSPENPAVFSIEHTFAKPGSYKFWSEISRAQQHFTFGHAPLSVKGDGAPAKPEVSLARNVIVGDYQVSLTAPDRVAKGRTVNLTFDVHTLVGDGVALDDYLGENIHLVAIKADLSQFIHAHPSEAHAHAFREKSTQVVNAIFRHPMSPTRDTTGQRNSVAFTSQNIVNDDDSRTSDVERSRSRDFYKKLVPAAQAHGPTGDAPGYEPVNFRMSFPTAGFYKLFAQFRPEGSGLASDETLTASFWVEVSDRALMRTAERLLLASVSLVLMAGLSVVVFRYIHRAGNTQHSPQ